MPRSSIPKALILEREKKVWAMRVRGATYERIAKELGITFVAVHKILDRMHQRYIKRNMDSVQKCRQEQIAELTHIADEANQAWERSKKTKVIKKKRAIGKDGKYIGGMQSSEETYEQEGDPRYLQVYMKAKEDLRKIIGADAPNKNEHTGKDGGAIKFEDQNKIDARDQLKNLLSNVLDKLPAKED